jgi:hypothetical protein
MQGGILRFNLISHCSAHLECYRSRCGNERQYNVMPCEHNCIQWIRIFISCNFFGGPSCEIISFRSILHDKTDDFSFIFSIFFWAISMRDSAKPAPNFLPLKLLIKFDASAFTNVKYCRSNIKTLKTTLRKDSKGKSIFALRLG